MKGISKNKRGISLIVLVITIIVMIILASAIILSLRSSGIIGRANEAKTTSDLASKKEAASVKLAEYELAVQTGESSVLGKTASEYVIQELEKDKVDTSDIVITDDGKIIVGIAALFINNNIPVGTIVTGYKLSNDASAKTVTTDGSEIDDDFDSDYSGGPVTYTREETITWKYMGINENGEAMIIGDVSENSPKVVLLGWGGSYEGPSTINKICKTMYSSDMGTARSVVYDDKEIILLNSLSLSDIYWLATTYEVYWDANDDGVEDEVDCGVYISGESSSSLDIGNGLYYEPMVDMGYNVYDSASLYYIRPIVTLFDYVQMSYNGTTVTLK